MNKADVVAAKMNSIKIRVEQLPDFIEMRVLITHPMENGRQRDNISDALIPANYIQQLTVKHNQQLIAMLKLTGGISKNPYFIFRLKSLSSGDRIEVTWTDNHLFSDEYQIVIP